jgi:hypothetical protein
MAGAAAERQETGFVNAVNHAVKKNKNNPITIIAGKIVIEGVVAAHKYKGRQESGSEPYTDVQLTVREKGKQKMLNLSLKGEAAPSLAGGGMKGLETILPGIGVRYMKAVRKYLVESVKLRTGDKVPDVYGRLSPAAKKKIVVGNERMGGPIDYMYIGRMTVDTDYKPDSNQLVLRGNLIPAEEYAISHDLYFRLRARREDQRFDPNAKDSTGAPKVYGKSPSRGDSAGRIVVTDKPPASAIIIKFS